MVCGNNVQEEKIGETVRKNAVYQHFYAWILQGMI